MIACDGVFNNVIEMIGNTSLIRINGIYLKLEIMNPTGSIKDRMAWYVVKKAEKRGELKKGMKIIEVTSGNTGISLAMISSIRGYKFLAIIPGSMSRERVSLMKMFGAKTIVTPAKDDMIGAVEKYGKIIKNINPKSVWLPRQFENPDNIEAHRVWTGKEIIHQVREKIDAFVAGIGTGGTLIGVGQALKKIYPDTRIIGVEPAESPIISEGTTGSHLIQGIGEGFIPKLVKENFEWIDEIERVKSKDAIKMSKILARKYGLLVGISSGANFLAALRIKKKYNLKTVVTIFPDRGERYLSIFKGR